MRHREEEYWGPGTQVGRVFASLDSSAIGTCVARG